MVVVSTGDAWIDHDGVVVFEFGTGRGMADSTAEFVAHGDGNVDSRGGGVGWGGDQVGGAGEIFVQVGAADAW